MVMTRITANSRLIWAYITFFVVVSHPVFGSSIQEPCQTVLAPLAGPLIPEDGIPSAGAIAMPGALADLTPPLGFSPFSIGTRSSGDLGMNGPAQVSFCWRPCG